MRGDMGRRKRKRERGNVGLRHVDLVSEEVKETSAFPCTALGKMAEWLRRYV